MMRLPQWMLSVLPGNRITDEDRRYRAALVRRFDERGETVSIGAGRMADELERLRAARGEQ